MHVAISESKSSLQFMLSSLTTPMVHPLVHRKPRASRVYRGLSVSRIFWYHGSLGITDLSACPTTD